MTKVYWEATQGGDGIITLIKELLYADREPENMNTFVFSVRSGFMEGEFRVSREELVKLKTFLKEDVK